METGKQTAVNTKKSDYDRVTVGFPKGEREIIQEHAGMLGITTQQLIRRAVYETIENDRRNYLSVPHDYEDVYDANGELLFSASSLRDFDLAQYRRIRGKLLPYAVWEKDCFEGLQDDINIQKAIENGWIQVG